MCACKKVNRYKQIEQNDQLRFIQEVERWLNNGKSTMYYIINLTEKKTNAEKKIIEHNTHSLCFLKNLAN